MKKIALIFMHGMGTFDWHFDQKIKQKLERKIGVKWESVHCEKNQYFEELQKNQELLYDRLSTAHLDWNGSREFMMFFIGDAAALSQKITDPLSPYIVTEKVIQHVLSNTFDVLGAGKKDVIIVAHSLGGHMISNYIWDCQHGKGFWNFEPSTIRGEKDNFVKLKNLQYLFTTGCNIPLLVSGNHPDAIHPINVVEDGYDIKWHNYYDKDDVLGWPLRPINDAYRSAIAEEEEMDVGTPLSNWNPFCHNHYWTNDQFIEKLSGKILELL